MWTKTTFINLLNCHVLVSFRVSTSSSNNNLIISEVKHSIFASKLLRRFQVLLMQSTQIHSEWVIVVFRISFGFWFPWSLVLLVVATALFTYITLLLVCTPLLQIFIFYKIHFQEFESPPCKHNNKYVMLFRCWQCAYYRRVRGCTFTGAIRFCIQREISNSIHLLIFVVSLSLTIFVFVFISDRNNGDIDIFSHGYCHPV